jgi:glycolate oxidase FAD binding subunit
MQPRVDALLEGTEAGLSAQSEQLKSMAGQAIQSEGTGEAWNSRQQLFLGAETDGDNFAVAKFATLPAEISETIELTAQIAGSSVRWSAVVQATGIGWMRMDGEGSDIASVTRALRQNLERQGGSLVVVRRPMEIRNVDAWVNLGDAAGLMRAVKTQFDPKGTLNPGRFVSGI